MTKILITLVLAALARGAWAGTAANQLRAAAGGEIVYATEPPVSAPAKAGQEEGPYLPRLKPVSYSDITAGLKKARGLVFEWKENTAAPRFAVPWTYLNGNHCADRALATYLALAAPDGQPVLKIPLSQAAANAYTASPAIEATQIDLMAPINGKQTLYFPDGTSKEYPISWSHHRALGVNVDGQLMAIDLAASDEPLPIKDWVGLYFREYEKVKCSNLNEAEYVELMIYETCLHNGWIPGPHGEVPVCKEPKLTCGYKFLEDVGFDPKVKGDAWGGLISATAGVAYAFASDLQNLQADTGLKLDPVKEVPDLRSKLILDYPSTWTHKY